VVHSLACGDDVTDVAVNVDGPGGRVDDVRVLLPFVAESLVLLPAHDASRFGWSRPLPATTNAAPGCSLHGPAGVVVLAAAVVAAERVVLPPGVADDVDVVDIRVDGDRTRTFRRVPVVRGAHAALFIGDDALQDVSAGARARLA
jgi:propanediol utilization protein